MNDFLMPGLVLLGVAVGALLVWLLSLGRTRSAVEAAVARSEAFTQGDLAQLRELVRAADETKGANLILVSEVSALHSVAIKTVAT